MVHVHGMMMCKEEHTAVPMQFASNGYLVVVPDMLDQTAPHTTNKNGEDVFYENDALASNDLERIDSDQKRRYNDYRVPHVLALGNEIKDKGFLE